MGKIAFGSRYDWRDKVAVYNINTNSYELNINGPGYSSYPPYPFFRGGDLYVFEYSGDSDHDGYPYIFKYQNGAWYQVWKGPVLYKPGNSYAAYYNQTNDDLVVAFENRSNSNSVYRYKFSDNSWSGIGTV